MSAVEHRVGIVTDPDFGERILPLAIRLHVWAVDSLANRAAAERLWTQQPRHDVERGATVFRFDAAEPPDQRVIRILNTVLEHHGEYSHDPPVSVLEIFGAPLTAGLQQALAGAGFTSIMVDGDAVLARVPPAA